MRAVEEVQRIVGRVEEEDVAEAEHQARAPPSAASRGGAPKPRIAKPLRLLDQIGAGEDTMAVPNIAAPAAICSELK